MQINNTPSPVTITFSPKEYWLRKNTTDPVFLGDYCLTARIDMSYAGKDDQEGPVVLYLTEPQAKLFKLAGFDELI